MRLSIPKRPNPRDWLIYQQVVCDNLSQSDVAADHHISQSQVSRICRRMREFMLMSRPLEERFSAEDLAWLAQQRCIEQLEFAQLQALETFKHGSGGCRETTITKRGSSGDNQGSTSIRRPGEADPRLLRLYVDLALKLRDAQVEEARAVEPVVAQLEKSRLWQEDWRVTQAIRTINDLRHYVVRMLRSGYRAPLLPEFDQEAVILHVRNKCRENRDAKVADLLPEEWQAVSRAVVQAPIARQEGGDAAARRQKYAWKWDDFGSEGPAEYSLGPVPTYDAPRDYGDAAAASGDPARGDTNMHKPERGRGENPLQRSA